MSALGASWAVRHTTTVAIQPVRSRIEDVTRRSKQVFFLNGLTFAVRSETSIDRVFAVILGPVSP